MCFYYFLFDLHWNHPSLGKDRYNFPKDKQERFIVKTVKELKYYKISHQYILWFREKNIYSMQGALLP